MSRITALGPFVSRLNKYAYIDVDGYEDSDNIEFVIPDAADSFLRDIGALDIEISSNGGDIQIEWILDLKVRDGGVDLWGITVNRVWGTLKFDVAVPDPLSDAYQEFKHEMEFNTDSKLVKNKRVPSSWTLGAKYEELSLSRGIWPQGIEINVNDKSIKVDFN
jgi:hypothetical protein